MIELLFLREVLLEEAFFICDLIPIFPGFYNTSTIPTPPPQIAAVL